MGKLTQYSASNLVAEAHVDADKWNQQPSAKKVAQTVENIQRRGMAVIRAQNGDIALETLKDLIPPGAEVMSCSSTTLIEIGFERYVKVTNHYGEIFIALSSPRTMKKRDTSCEENLLLLITSSLASTPLRSRAKSSRATSQGAAWGRGRLQPVT
jgi:LUD domain